MKYFFLLAALLLAGGPAAAQTPRGATPPDSLTSSLAAAPAVPDTVAAIHRLFAAKRKRGTLVVAGTAAAILTGASLVASQSPDALFSQADRVKMAGLFVVLPGILIIAVELIFTSDFSRQSEAQVVEEFRTHKLPRYLKRRLKPKYFQ